MELIERKLASTLGKYRLIALLGTGGMGNVYLAVMRGQSDVRRLVVLKVPRDEVTNDPSLLAMFIDEARIAARLNHPNVVQTFEIIREDDRDIIVMEYLDGYTLNEAILRTRKDGVTLPRSIHLRIIAEALTGLHYAHEATDFDGTPLNLVHRDISPHNIFLTFDGQVKVLDFGIAKAAMQSHHTEVGTFKGKVRHMPMEQLAGSGIDRRADVFAVGTMLWEAAVGERLWKKKKNDVEVMSAVIAGEIPTPKEANPDVPDELDAICRKALAHAKEDRYANCLELKDDLEAYLALQPERVTLRNMVHVIEKVFADKRSARKRIIDDQLKSVMQAAAGAEARGSLPLLPMASLPSLNPTTTASSGSGTPLTRVGMATSEMVPAPRRAAVRPALLVFLALAALAGVALLLRRSRTLTPTPTPTSVASQPPAASALAPGAVVVESAAASASGAADPAPPPTKTAPPIVGAADPSTPSARAAGNAGATPGGPTVTTAHAPVQPMRPAITTFSPPARSPPPASTPPSATAAPPAEAPGTFSFTTYPWTRIHEGGRLLGTTPLYKIPLSAGTHVLTLENAEEGVKTTYTVTIKSGESVNRSMALK